MRSNKTEIARREIEIDDVRFMKTEKRTIKIKAIMSTNLEFTDRTPGTFSQKFVDFLVDFAA